MARSRRDVGLLFATRIVRMFAYGALSVVLALYLAESSNPRPSVIVYRTIIG